LLLPLIHLMYKYSPAKIHTFLCLSGKYSYEIFLFQMLVFFVSDVFLSEIREMIVGDSRILSFIYMICIIPLCYIPILKSKNK
jgi:hypothetical protein